MTSVPLASRAIAPCVARGSARDERSRVAARTIADARARLDHGVSATLACGRDSRSATGRHVAMSSLLSRASCTSLVARPPRPRDAVARRWRAPATPPPPPLLLLRVRLLLLLGEDARRDFRRERVRRDAPRGEAARRRQRRGCAHARRGEGARGVARPFRAAPSPCRPCRDGRQGHLGCDGVVNLAGEPISTRWSPAIKAEIMASRIKATKRIADAIAACPADRKPRRRLRQRERYRLYGTSENRVFDESAPAGGITSARCARPGKARRGSWNAPHRKRASFCFASESCSTATAARWGRCCRRFRSSPAGRWATARSGFSWIHREDAVGIILESLSNTGLRGPVNVTAPNPVRMGEMCAALGRSPALAQGRPLRGYRRAARSCATVALQGQKVGTRGARGGIRQPRERAAAADAADELLR